MDINVVFDRILRLSRLDTAVFDEVRDDERELVPAIIVAIVSFLLAGVGAWLWWLVVPDVSADDEFINNVILGTIFGVVLYGVAAVVIYVVLAQMYRVTMDLQSLIRPFGYAAIPMALSLVMLIPFIWPVFALVPLALLFVFMIYATQSASNADSNQVVMATTAGFAVMVLVLGILALQSDLPSVPMGVGIFGILFDFTT